MITNSIRRHAVLTVAAAVALTALSGCQDSPSGTAAPTAAAPATSAAPVAGAFEPEAALANAEKTPYAANVKITTEAAGRPLSTMTGRSNFNALFTGRSEIRSSAEVPASQSLWMETVTTTDANYFRNRKAGTNWVKAPRAAGNNQADYGAYAKLLLAGGPSAKKGMENQGGIPTYHLAGHLEIDQVASVDPRTHRSMKAKGVTGFDCDQWIDSKGRTIRFEQRMNMYGIPSVNKATFTDFGPAETFAPPTEG
ncbi:hypothetical protein ACH44C_11940 [Streptomyces purpureus]|uniref:hypothetical protein n=1 Tax=Streptomyces purpureus TaxID=1951 RepID=UPI00378FC5F8